ncbi:MAG TPA: ABC transporter substrate-binding protein [Bacillales bacterium]|nr:ABC transporter substrate-binding protein [Bacillales bacterium]
MKKMKWLSWIFAGLLVFSLAACSGNGDSGNAGGSGDSGGSGEAKQITFWGPFSGPDGPNMKKIVDAYNDSQSKYHVNFQIVPQSDYYKKVDLSFNSKKNTPDVLIIHGNQLTKYVNKGLLKDLSGVIGDKIKKSDYNKTAIEQDTFDGKLYAIPLDIHPLIMYWNKDMFKAAGLDPNKPPQTREEFIKMTQKLTNAEKGEYGYVVPTLWPQQFIFPTIVYQNGGLMVKDGKVDFTSDAVVNALKFEHDLIYKYKVSPKNVQQDGEVTLFLQGKNAIQFNGPWMLNQFKEAGLNFGEAPVPQLGTETQAVYTDGHNFAIPKSDDEETVKGVMDFLKYVAGHGMAWAQSGQAPAAKATYTSEEFQSLKYQPAIVKEFEYAQFAPKDPNWGTYTTPLWEAINKVLLGKADAKGALQKAEDEANKAAK